MRYWFIVATYLLWLASAGRGVAQFVSPAGKGRCTECGCMQLLRVNGCVINHSYRGQRCLGGGEHPAEDPAIACWLPILPDLTPHGLRHGHQTMMDEAGIRYGLTAERMGHEVPGMRGTYGHVSPAMRAELVDALQTYWESSLRRRAELSPRSLVPTLDGLLRTIAA